MTLALALLMGAAWANGQTTHVHISLHALEHLPPGELRDLLTQPDLLPYLVNGTMFPDGGYPIGDDYGEISHWEPFQNTYERWIVAQYPDGYTGEGAQHLAFRMGMASHGMADQFFDAAFMERSRYYDAALGWSSGEGSLDDSTDVMAGAWMGGLEPPEAWFPGELFVSMFQEVSGHTVTVDTIAEGHQLLGLAIRWIAAVSQQDDVLADHISRFPWSAEHFLDASTPGSPPCEGVVVARYWEAIWARMGGAEGFGPEELLGTVPAEGQLGWPLGTEGPDDIVHIVLSRGLDSNSLDHSLVQVVDGDGAPVPVSVRVFYGYASHVLNIEPEGGWSADTDYTLTLGAGVPSFDGATTQTAHTLHFSTRAPAPTPQVEEPRGCSSSPARPGAWGALVLLALTARGRCRTLLPVRLRRSS